MKWWQTINNKIKQVDSLLFLLSAIILNRITDLLPDRYVSPFPFHKIMYQGHEFGISIQNYCYYIDLHLIFIMFWNFCYKRLPAMAQLFYIYRAIEIIGLFDFMLIYEKPFMHIGSYGLEITDFRILIYFALYILWKRRA